MKQLIHIGNYESFYLDYLEGELSAEERSAFELFLSEHPELRVDEDLIEVEPVRVNYNPLEKSLLKQSDDSFDFDSDLDYYAISLVEGVLSADEIESFREHLIQSRAAQSVVKEYVSTKLVPDEAERYAYKEQLKQKEIAMLPAWKWGVSIAGTVAAIVILVLPYTERQTNPVAVFSANRTNPKTNSDSSQMIVSTPKWNFEENQKTVFTTEGNLVQKAVASPNSENQEVLVAEEINGRHHPTILPEVADARTSISGSLTPENTEKNNKDLAFATSVKKDESASNSNASYTKPEDKPKTPQAVPQDDEKRGFYMKIGWFEISFKKGGKK